MSTLIELLKKTTEYFEKKSYENPRVSAEKLFSKALNMDRIMLYANFDVKLTKEQIDSIKSQLDTKEDENKDTLKYLLDSSIEYLVKHNINESRLIAELIFSKVLKISHMTLFMKYDMKINNEDKNKIREYLIRIAIDKIPYQYVFNEQNFYGRNFYVDKSVLIPRYDTEILVEKVLNIAKTDDIILDIGTGSGAIALTLALELPNSKVLAVDISENAVEIAKKNKQILNVKNTKIIKSDLFSNITYDKFDIIVSNPPYISNDEIEYISADTILHEPLEALFANNNGLYFYYEIARNAKNFLKDGGYLALEIGFKQKNAVNEILKNFSYVDITNYKDLNGNDRVVIARVRNEHK